MTRRRNSIHGMRQVRQILEHLSRLVEADAEQRSHEREAQRGGGHDMSAEQRVLATSLRTGKLTHERIKAAAELGDEVALDYMTLNGENVTDSDTSIAHAIKAARIEPLDDAEIIDFAADVTERGLSALTRALPGDKRAQSAIEAVRHGTATKADIEPINRLQLHFNGSSSAVYACFAIISAIQAVIMSAKATKASDAAYQATWATGNPQQETDFQKDLLIKYLMKRPH